VSAAARANRWQSAAGWRNLFRDRPLIPLTALLAILAGTLIDIYFAVVLGHGTPTPYWDDLLFLGAYVLFLPTAWLLTGHSFTVGRSARWLLAMC